MYRTSSAKTIPDTSRSLALCLGPSDSAFLTRLCSTDKHFLWYLATWATMSPALSESAEQFCENGCPVSNLTVHLKCCYFVNTIGSSRLSAEETLGFLGLLCTGLSGMQPGAFARLWCVMDLSFCLKCSLFCSLQFGIVIFEFAGMVVQSIICDHSRFNTTAFIDSFQLKCSWKLSKLTDQIGCE